MLTGKQRRHLRGLGHALKPIVQVGKDGIDDGLIAAVEQALSDHELIKIRFVDGKSEKAELVAELVARTGAASAGTVGHVAMLYREHEDLEKRRIDLPD